MSDTELANIINKNLKTKPKDFWTHQNVEIGIKICLL